MTTILGWKQREICAVCGSDQIRVLNDSKQCMDCLEMGVSFFGARDEITKLASDLVYAGLTSQPQEQLRGDLIQAANRFVVLSREVERRNTILEDLKA